MLLYLFKKRQKIRVGVLLLGVREGWVEGGGGAEKALSQTNGG